MKMVFELPIMLEPRQGGVPYQISLILPPGPGVPHYLMMYGSEMDVCVYRMKYTVDPLLNHRSVHTNRPHFALY